MSKVRAIGEYAVIEIDEEDGFSENDIVFIRSSTIGRKTIGVICKIIEEDGIGFVKLSGTMLDRDGDKRNVFKLGVFADTDSGADCLLLGGRYT